MQEFIFLKVTVITFIEGWKRIVDELSVKVNLSEKW